MAQLVVASVDKASWIPHTDVISPTFEGYDGDDVWWVQSQRHLGVTYKICALFTDMQVALANGIVKQLLQTSNCCYVDVYQPYNKEYH
jgi:hypothetical protein